MKRQLHNIPVTLTGGYLSSIKSQTRYGFRDDALLYSENHRHKNGVWLSGGPFLLRRRNYIPSERFQGRGVYQASEYIVDFMADANSFTTPVVALTPAELSNFANIQNANTFSYGATAWKRMRPGKAVFSGLNSLWELKDFPSIPLRALARLASIRKVGKEFLNAEFGWDPLLSDIRKMYELQVNTDKALAQLVRDNGRGIRRRTTLENSTTTRVVEDRLVSLPGQFISGYGHPTWGGGYTRTTTTETVSTHIWGCGRFRYYIPDIGTSQWTKRARRALWGLNPTPEVLWNALPWSWLADWFANVGDVMSNMSVGAAENLVADYAFTMRETSTKSTTVVTSQWNGVQSAPGVHPSLRTSVPSGRFSLASSNELTMKSRSTASPFGFGLHWPDFNDRQVAVLAALGISRRD